MRSSANGAILGAYLGSFLMAGAFQAIGSCISAATRSQVIAFVLTVVVCLGFLLVGYGPALDVLSPILPDSLTEVVSRFSFITNFEALGKGVIEGTSVVFFVSLIAVFLVATAAVIEWKKA